MNLAGRVLQAHGRRVVHAKLRLPFSSFLSISGYCSTKTEGSGRETSLQDFIRQVNEISMAKVKTRWFPNPFVDYDANHHLNKDALKAQGVEYLEKALTKGSSDGDGGLYVGAIGVTYAYLHVKHLLTPAEREKYLPMAQQAFQNQSKYNAKHPGDEKDSCAFLLGKAGYFAVGAVLAYELGDATLAADCIKSYIQAGQVCKRINFFKAGGDELFVGRAGYLIGALWMMQKLGNKMPIPKDTLKDVWTSIVESGQKYALNHKSPCPLMYSYYDTEYLGAAHGLCAILQALLSFPCFLKENAQAEKMIKTTLEYYLTLQDAQGNFPCAMDELGRKARSESDMLVHWCHGAPGAVYMLAKAYLVFHERKYLDACIKCGEITWNRGLLRKGPGICHGVAGSGYVFLLIDNLLEHKDPKYLYRAMKFAEFLRDPEFAKGARRPDSPYSLYEGIAGTACFVLDLLQPQQSEFPFFNVRINYNG